MSLLAPRIEQLFSTDRNGFEEELKGESDENVFRRVGRLPNVRADSTRRSAFQIAFARTVDVEEDDFGDPQWSYPCGGTLTEPGKSTGAVTKLEGGEKLHLRIQEMAFHPGSYRVALAVNSRNELPPDPEPISKTGQDGRQRSISGAIQYLRTTDSCR